MMLYGPALKFLRRDFVDENLGCDALQSFPCEKACINAGFALDATRYHHDVFSAVACALHISGFQRRIMLGHHTDELFQRSTQSHHGLQLAIIDMFAQAHQQPALGLFARFR
jgi:hypothetical protein